MLVSLTCFDNKNPYYFLKKKKKEVNTSAHHKAKKD